MAIKPKQIIDAVVGVGKTAVEAADRRLRNRKDGGPKTSGPPSTVGAPKPGAAGAHKSGTAPKAKPRKPAKKRATASRAAATSGEEVADAAKKKG
jgi:hypothetical protein